MGKRKKQQTKPEDRSGVVSVVSLPGGRKAEMVREGDPDGRPVAHSRTIDTLARMKRSGAITPAMYDAGRDFQARFTLASLDTMRCMPLVRISGGNGDPGDLTDRQVAARENVHRAILSLGGMNSPAGSCAWYVVGLQVSIREWALRQGWGGRLVRQEAARGILVAGLGLLATHYGYDRTYHI
jgi:hypothetical protein